MPADAFGEQQRLALPRCSFWKPLRGARSLAAQVGSGAQVAASREVLGQVVLALRPPRGTRTEAGAGVPRAEEARGLESDPCRASPT